MSRYLLKYMSAILACAAVIVCLMGSAMAQEKAASPSAKTEASPAQNAAKTLVGAIRWDGWNKCGFYDSCFDAPEWRYRLPFFATITPEGKARLRETSQEVIDK